MSRLTFSALFVLALAACSKQEPPSIAAAATPASPPPAATAAPPAAAKPPAPAAPAPAPVALGPDDLLKQGAEIFAKTCATCHMADGSGVPFLQPSIKGSGWISAADPQPLLSLILRGSAILGEASKAYDNDMAPQEHLSDTEIAAVATYVRSRFAAAPIPAPVTPAQVAIARARPGLPQ